MHIKPSDVKSKTTSDHPIRVALEPNLSRQIVNTGGSIAPQSPPIAQLRMAC